ncbi:MAG TPA: hypothetical protein VJZ49_00550 [Syntrophales bacterium]|nr:hypothetical protein [Syntrophales bacterium]
MDTKDIVIASAAAQGMNQEMIEAKTGIPQSTVSRRLNKPEIKKLIERIQQELAVSYVVRRDRIKRLRHKSPNTTARYVKSLGLEGVRQALEDSSQQKGELLVFKPRGDGDDFYPTEKEKAVSGAVNS